MGRIGSRGVSLFHLGRLIGAGSDAGRYVSILREPRSGEKQRLNQEKWESLAEELRVPQQTAGVFTPGCGATYGVMEKCDFACTSCYLSEMAQHTRPMPFAQVQVQLDALRAALGPRGKVQITSGEVTLLPLEDLGRIIAYARGIGLDPMVMTNGQKLLHYPDYLPSLVQQYGLEKICFHVDTTQKGRKGMKAGAAEASIHTVRDQFARLVHQVRGQTGLKLHAAQTVTVTENNFDQLPAIVDWVLSNLDSFRMISFQPVAQIGRTRDSPPAGLSLDSVWSRICEGLGQNLNRHSMYFGHPACSITAPWIVVSLNDRRYIIEAARTDKRWDKRFFQRVVEQFGKFETVQSSITRSVVKAVGMTLRSPSLLLEAPFYALYRLWGLGFLPFVVLGHLVARQRVQIRPFVLVVHKFMDREELDTPLGRERLQACVFKLPVDGKMVSMCEMNGTQLREDMTRSLAGEGGDCRRS